MSERSRGLETRWALVALGEVLAGPLRALGLWSVPVLLWFGANGGLASFSPGYGKPPATMAWPVACGLLTAAVLQRPFGRGRGSLWAFAALVPVFGLVWVHAHFAAEPSLPSPAYTSELWPSLLVLMATLEWMRTPRPRWRGAVLGLTGGLFLVAVAVWDRGASLPGWGRAVCCAASLLGLSDTVRSRARPSLAILIVGVLVVGFLGVAPSGVPVDGPRVLLGATFVVCAALAAERIVAGPPPTLDAPGLLAVTFHRRATWLVPLAAFLVTTVGLVVLATGSRLAVVDASGWTQWVPRNSTWKPWTSDSYAWAVLSPLAVVPVVLGVTFRRERLANWGLPVFAALGALVALFPAPFGLATLTFAGGGGAGVVALLSITVILGLVVLVVGGIGWAVAGRLRSARLGRVLAGCVGGLAGLMHTADTAQELALGLSLVAAPCALAALSRSEARMRSLVTAAATGATAAALLAGPPARFWLRTRVDYLGTFVLDAVVLGALLALGAAAGRRLRSLTPVPDDHAIRTDFDGPELPRPPDAPAASG